MCIWLSISIFWGTCRVNVYDFGTSAIVVSVYLLDPCTAFQHLLRILSFPFLILLLMFVDVNLAKYMHLSIVHV